MEIGAMMGNAASIGLEIIGFAVMLQNTIRAENKGGNFATGFKDIKTGREPRNMVFIRDYRRYTIGIGFVIAGLAGQIIASFFG